MSRARAKVRHTLVVGASSGVGLLVARALTGEGIVVSTVGRKPSGIAAARHQACQDLTTADWDGIYRAAESDANAPLDAVVYVAGDAAFGRSRAVPAARARSLFEANMWSPASAALAAEALWSDRRRGTFVSVSSISARRAVPFEAHYCASKAAGARFLEALQLEHPDGRLRFVSLYPGRLATPFRAKADWYERAPDPAPSEGSDPAIVARAVLAILAGSGGGQVLGARERAIDLADRISPTLYDRLVLRGRVRKALARDGR